MKFFRFSILAVAALTCTAFVVSCESDDPSKAVAPFWTDGDVDGSGLNGSGLNGGNGFGDDFGLNGGDAGLRGGNGFGDGSGLNGGDNGFGSDGPGAFGEDLSKAYKSRVLV